MHGAERVALAEDYLQRVFRWALDLQFVMIAFALVLAALRQGTGHPELTLVSLGVVAVVAGWARCHLDDAYDVMRNTLPLVAGAAVLAVLLIVDDPQNSPLWWTGLAALVVPAVTGGLRCNCACAAVLTFGYAAGVVAHDHIDLAVHHPDLALKASGFSFWSLLLYGTINSTARFMMLWDRPLPEAWLPPRRVSAEVQPEQSPVDASAPRKWPALALRRDSSGETRQLEVITLLSDGLKQADIASMLRMSETQVQRHVSHAKKRLEAKSTAELVTIAVRDGHVPQPTGGSPSSPADHSRSSLP